jgi:acetyl/propionyl-CoA carboxylase alpha subunit
MRNLLVANRGEIASRVFRSAREYGLQTAAVFSDADAGLPYVREADHAVRLPGTVASDTYLRGDLVVEAAHRTGADAIHPGYGFLAENAEFAQRVLDAGLTWVGPPPDAMTAMGSKVEAKRLIREAGVPTLPWATDAGGAAGLGYPLLVKASAGGGGRGMRVVSAADELAAAIESAEREAGSAFGDGSVFLERYLPAPRHIEVQIVADGHGNVVSLFERECSIQRRHQKVVEESPSPAVDASLRAELGNAAVMAAKAVGYVGAGTVEFVLDPDGSYYFLEMNTRLQVEHPVTEIVTGLDLVRLQFVVADGLPLPSEALAPTASGHAIEVRLCAEDAANEFLPATGVLRTFEIPSGVRVDTGVESGSVVSPHYDSLIAKVIAHAPTRAEAATTLALALRRARIHGVTTNRDLLVRILEEPDFRAGAIDTGYLERHDVAALAAPLADREAGRLHAVAGTLALQVVRRLDARVLAGLPSGWRNNPSMPQGVTLSESGVSRQIDYTIGRDGAIVLSVDSEPVDVILHSAAYHAIDATIAGVRRRFHVVVWPDRIVIDVSSALGSSSFTVAPRFPDPAASVVAGSLVAPMPGTVARVLVIAGEQVSQGQPLLVLEAMKMEHTVTSPAAGVVTDLRVEAGQPVDAGAVLAVVDDA